MATQTEYGIRRTVDLAYAAAVKRVHETLQAEGFGVLTEIDIREKLREKLGVDFRRYIILGACNPPLAHRALQAEPEIGLVLPCNVIVYEDGETRSVVAAFDPEVMLGVVDNPQLREIAVDAKKRLTRAVDAV
ncbi:MAG TPA: DUF302 domain-containing protein [Thermoanaerobaculia bacterium]|nr:DUF302 domain-containing protein [Thermoanaerobaculia bacterium]